MNGPDFSEYVVHFTKNTRPCANVEDAEVVKIAAMSARDRLYGMLTEGQIRATRMPWTNKPAVCFTECTWASLLFHARRYSPYGVGFHKRFLFATGGGPAIYLPPGLMKHQKTHVGAGQDPFHPHLFAFATPFVPAYAPEPYKNRFWKGKKPVDFSHEREWRVPHDLAFTPSRVAFVIVNKYEDMARAPKPLKDSIGRENWIIMSNYERTEELWPTHRMP